jgi:hypothetical protein
MTTAIVLRTIDDSAFARRRAVALANTKWFRAMGWRALREGAPKSELRAANARAAAQIVIGQAKREAITNRIATDALAAVDQYPRSALRNRGSEI